MVYNPHFISMHPEILMSHSSMQLVQPRCSNNRLSIGFCARSFQTISVLMYSGFPMSWNYFPWLDINLLSLHGTRWVWFQQSTLSWANSRRWEGVVTGHCDGARDLQPCLARNEKNLREKIVRNALILALNYVASEKRRGIGTGISHMKINKRMKK